VSGDAVDRTFGARWRVRGRSRFAEIHAAKVRRESGPLLIYALTNDLDHLRIGLSVGRRVGNAVRRNRVKRRLREAFRLHRDAWARGYDLLVVVRPHEPLSPDEYARHLGEAIARLDKAWRKRTSTPRPDDSTSPDA
jgi:ribonuclease P protein component